MNRQFLATEMVDGYKLHVMGTLTCSSSSSSSSMVDTVMVLYFDPISLVYRLIITYNKIVYRCQTVEQG